MLNLTELRKEYAAFETIMSQEEFHYGNISPKDGLIRLEAQLGRFITGVPKLLSIAETAAKYQKAKLIVYGAKSTREDFDHMICLEIELLKLLADVEIGST